MLLWWNLPQLCINAIVMKLTTIMYLHESVNRRKFSFRRKVYEFLDYIKNRHIWHALLVKFLYKVHEEPATLTDCYTNF